MKRSGAPTAAVALCIVVGVCSSAAFANIGISFAPDWDMDAVHVGLYQPFGAHIVLANSPSPMVDGLEVAYSIDVLYNGPANGILRLSENLYGGAGVATGSTSGAYVLTWQTPRPAGSPLVLVSWSLMLTAPVQVKIVLTEISNSVAADGLPSISYNGVNYPVAIKIAGEHSGCSGGPYQPCVSAFINVQCGVPDEAQSWGAIKALYR